MSHTQKHNSGKGFLKVITVFYKSGLEGITFQQLHIQHVYEMTIVSFHIQDHNYILMPGFPLLPPCKAQQEQPALCCVAQHQP